MIIPSRANFIPMDKEELKKLTFANTKLISFEEFSRAFYGWLKINEEIKKTKTEDREAKLAEWNRYHDITDIWDRQKYVGKSL